MIFSNGRIRHQDSIQKYAPPGHNGTVNIRLIDKNFCGSFEIAHGTLEPGGAAHEHYHEKEYQVIYILEGQCDVSLNKEPVVRCKAGTIIEIPPLVSHEVIVTGEFPLKVLVIYSPPLPKRDDVDIN